MPSLRRALELDPHEPRRVHRARRGVQRKQQKWADLADTLRAHAEVETDTKTKVDLLLGLGDLLREPARVDGEGDRGVPGRRRSRRQQRRRARRARAAVPPRRAVGEPRQGARPPRRDLRRRPATPAAPRRCAASSRRCAPRSSATSRARSRATRPRSPRTAATPTALKALVDLYDKTGRTEDYLRTMERLGAGRARGREARDAAQARRRARGSRSGARARCVREAARRRSERRRRVPRPRARAQGARRTGTSSSRSSSRHIAAVKTPAQRVELYLESRAGLRAASSTIRTRRSSALLNVLAIEENNKTALAALPRLYVSAPRRATARSTCWSATRRSRATRARRSTPRPAASRSSS